MSTGGNNDIPLETLVSLSGANQSTGQQRIQLDDSFYAYTRRLWDMYATALTDDREPERTDAPPPETSQHWNQILRQTYDRISRHGGESMEIVQIISTGLEEMLRQFVDNQLLDMIYRVIRGRENTHNIHEISLRLLTRLGQIATGTPWMTDQSIDTMNDIVADIQVLSDAVQDLPSGPGRTHEGPSLGSMIQDASPGLVRTSGETLQRVAGPVEQPTKQSARPRSANRPVVNEPTAAQPMRTPRTRSTEMQAYHEANRIARRRQNPVWKHICSHLCGCGQSSGSERASSESDTNA